MHIPEQFFIFSVVAGDLLTFEPQKKAIILFAETGIYFMVREMLLISEQEAGEMELKS